MSYNASDHPRAPKGTPQGGQFTQKPGVGVDDDINVSEDTSLLDFQPASNLHTSIRATSHDGIPGVQLPEGEPTHDDRAAWEDYKQWVQNNNIATSITGLRVMELEDAAQLAHAQNTIMRNHIAAKFDAFTAQHRFWRGGKQALQELKQTTLSKTSQQPHVLQLQFPAVQCAILDNVQRDLDAFAEREQVRPLRTNPQVARMVEAHPEYAQYLNPDKHDANQAIEVVNGLQFGLDVSQYNDPDRYDARQMREVYWGLRHNLDVSQYNNPEAYDADQMHWVFMGLRDGCDVSVYNQPKNATAQGMQRAYERQMRERGQYVTPLQGQHFGARYQA